MPSRNGDLYIYICSQMKSMHLLVLIRMILCTFISTAIKDVLHLGYDSPLIHPTSTSMLIKFTLILYKPTVLSIRSFPGID
jgi:hypothetical protein